MAPSSSLISKLKVQLKLAISRLRMVQQKDTALAKQSRRSMAQLLEQGKLESARIRIENIIRSDLTTELHEILELYCELLLARHQLLDPPTSTLSPSASASSTPAIDPGLEEAVRSLVYAAPRTDVKELHAARALLVEKFGKEFAVSAMEGVGVAPRVLGKLRVETPREELVEAYMREIARTYGVRIPGDESDDDDDDGDGEGGDGVEEGDGEDPSDDDDDDEPSAGQKVPVPATPLKASSSAKDRELSKATPPRALGPASPLRIAPPSPSSENVAPKVKGAGAGVGGRIGAGAGTGGRTGAGAGTGPAGKARMKKVAEEKEDGGGGGGPGGKIPDVDELAKRFAALKR